MTLRSDWDKTGTMIEGKYLGKFPYQGIISGTRVMYGGDVQYIVTLLDHIEVYGEWRSSILVQMDKDKQNYKLLEQLLDTGK